MDVIKQKWRSYIHMGLQLLLLSAKEERTETAIDIDDVVVENPPRPEFGDVAFPMFHYSKLLRRSPAILAKDLLRIMRARKIVKEEIGEMVARGPYLNIWLNRTLTTDLVINEIRSQGAFYGRTRDLQGQRILIEFSCPNTNKPLHLGHLRNDALGESISQILETCGADVIKVNLINDRGVHICQSMLGYMMFGENRTPAQEGIKGDHFVGEYYVRFHRWAKEHAEADSETRSLLRKWELNDPETVELWQEMNQWTIKGIQETYKNTGISFDKVYYESETYLLGKDYIESGIEKGVFYRERDGSVWVNLEEWGLDKKVLLRSDGTSLYLTQDIGTATQRYEDWKFKRMIYVVASEQDYHFKVLFKVLHLLGHDWADQLYHLSYGMVNLPAGKMKSREGTVVDADDLLDELIRLAKNEIADKGREEYVQDIAATSREVALAAINYYLLHTSPFKDMVFNPEASISFTGNTGPYLQYTGARISSMLNKFEERRFIYEKGTFQSDLLTVDEEWEIVKLLASYPDRIRQVSLEMNPSLLALHLFDLAKVFSRYYQDNPVLHNENPHLVVTRIELTRCVQQVLRNGYKLLGIPFLEKM